MAYTTVSEWTRRAARGENPNLPRKQTKRIQRLLAGLTPAELALFKTKIQEMRHGKRKYAQS